MSASTGLPMIVDTGAYSCWTRGAKPNWDKARSIAEEYDAEYIVALDKVGEPEESLKLSLETFKSTHIEKIVPFQAVTLGRPNWKQIKQHLKILLDNGVRVFGIPCPASNKNGNLQFALRTRFIIPTRCHALGFPYNSKYKKQLRDFDSVDANMFYLKNETGDVGESIIQLYRETHCSGNQPLAQYIKK